ncbi:MAG TPA: M3 family oligoendopeptidase [Nitrososphaeraceae archaeon]|jgi:oligoendopeptidase F|nr:M3 family oligoendopeptidase [Nitrososphaeraceae archaeon]
MLNYSDIKLGKWDLSDLVDGSSRKEFVQLVDTIKRNVKEFEDSRQLLKPDLNTSTFESLIHKIENILEKLSTVSSFANLRYAADTASNEAAALILQTEQLGSQISNQILFFDLWFKKELANDNAQRLIDGISVVYGEYLRHKRLVAKYSLNESEEKIINTLEVTGTSALVKIYDRMTNNFEYTFIKKRGNIKTIKTFTNKEKLLSLVRSSNANEREYAYKALFKTYEKNSGVLGDIYQNLVTQWRDENISIRGFKSPISVRNIYNNIDDSTVEILLSVCKKNATLFHDYFKEKAKLIGVKKLRRYDLYAPITKKNAIKFSFKNAAKLVLDTFYKFDPRFGTYTERLFKEGHIDSEIRKGKTSGAFCYTVSPQRTPYVLLNFDGKMRDVSTMAHEFGHAIHSMFASDKPILVSHAPLPLAETASVFGEMLLDEQIYKKLNREKKKIFLAEQIDDMYATIMRQAFFTIFEIEAHKYIAEQSVTIDNISDLYINNLKTQFGDSLRISDDFKWEWLYIPHFFHTPFYCYAYSFGNLLVLSLYQQYMEEGKSFVSKYREILSAGGSEKPETLLRNAGFNITEESFWQKGFDLVKTKIDKLRVDDDS